MKTTTIKSNVIQFPGTTPLKPTEYRLTKRGKVVVAIAKVAALVVAGMVFGHVLTGAIEAEGSMRDAQNAPYVQALQEKEMRQEAAQHLGK